MASWIGTGASNPGDVKTNGKIGVGVDPGYPLEVVGRSRVRGASSAGGGLWLTDSATPTSNETYIGRGTDAENFVGIYNNGGWRLVVDSNGNVGIKDTTPSSYTALDVNGWVRAEDYVEYSPLFEGDAVSLIKRIKSKGKPSNGWADIDHSSLPDGVKLKIKEKRWYDKTKNKKMPRDFAPEKNNNKKYTQRTETVQCRSLSGSVQLNLRAIKQLVERVESLEKEVKKSKSRK
jgi:hypothetical protein